VGGTSRPHEDYERCTETLVGKRQENKPLGRSKHRCEDNIKMHIMNKGSEGVDWIQLAQYMIQLQTFVSMLMKLQVP
jgi:hypothetical protein